MGLPPITIEFVTYVSDKKPNALRWGKTLIKLRVYYKKLSALSSETADRCCIAIEFQGNQFLPVTKQLLKT